jgi:hypothetical protein
MQDERHAPGMPQLHRQPARGGPDSHAYGGSPVSSPETRPTPLERHYLVLSAVALACGAIATALLLVGVHLGSPAVKLCIVVGAPILLVTTTDAGMRIWRAAWAWMPVDRGRGLFRLASLTAILVAYAVTVTISWLVLTA